eukprot:gnl/TRDRNA2_/TRDRNA2_175858_c2_seq1.p1 gnl/TRDRNA2_/TRDRNA2_175858_c2~~gnl/TRDRNA2_/TRDRNA2_175858_c2_seq1.p1  ORF type:complete len:239 (+),score=43.39 gnl/TRDRNA2_/TRDRNA2_175858_c2_seq1:241-957(+)
MDSIVDVFKQFDLDGNGTISRDELTRVLKSLNEAWDDAKCSAIFDAADADRDGAIDYTEFAAWVCSSEEGDEVLGKCGGKDSGAEPDVLPEPSVPQEVLDAAKPHLDSALEAVNKLDKSKLKKIVDFYPKGFMMEATAVMEVFAVLLSDDGTKVGDIWKWYTKVARNPDAFLEQLKTFDPTAQISAEKVKKASQIITSLGDIFTYDKDGPLGQHPFAIRMYVKWCIGVVEYKKIVLRG